MADHFLDQISVPWSGKDLAKQGALPFGNFQVDFSYFNLLYP